MQYGFTCNDKDGVEKPLCLICNKTLSTESMKPSKLKSHINTKHAKYSGKPIEYFERLFKAKIFHYESNLHASYEASYLIAKSTKPY